MEHLNYKPDYIQHVTLIPGRFAFYEVILGYFDRAKPILKLLLAS